MASFIAQAPVRLPASPDTTWRSAGASHILLIAAYRRISGSALTASTPSAVPAAARVIAVAYPRARIIFLLLSARKPTLPGDIAQRRYRAPESPPARFH